MALKRQVGFSLIELLVSMALLSMVVLVGSLAISLFSSRWNGQLGVFDETMRSNKYFMLTHDVLNSLLPYVVYSREGKPVIFFEGNRNGFVSVASTSLFSGNFFTVVRLSVKQNPDLTFDVIYEESAMIDQMFTRLDQEVVFSQPLVLFQEVKDPMFQYFGLKDHPSQLSEFETAISPSIWLDEYNALDSLFAPEKVLLEFSSSAGRHNILANVRGQPPGLVSRYKSKKPLNPSSPVDIFSDIIPPADDCDC
jgi:prepilin-type N-terminal cleavage/methylation domain-containing protein